eukprot:GHVT01072654.1.p1 GENE.GHVT01072654.1~~GHVT01072654.1.p1  ORF type:complete len:129 (+),score=9.60 GHVT01072654.1:203-589(+)
MRITPSLLRRHAGHHDDSLSSLEEIALHQLEIEKIEAFKECCRDIQILLLQNNLIPKMENLRGLRHLRYLNLALNNIQQIEGIGTCENLEKVSSFTYLIFANSFCHSVPTRLWLYSLLLPITCHVSIG